MINNTITVGDKRRPVFYVRIILFILCVLYCFYYVPVNAKISEWNKKVSTEFFDSEMKKISDLFSKDSDETVLPKVEYKTYPLPKNINETYGEDTYHLEIVGAIGDSHGEHKLLGPKLWNYPDNISHYKFPKIESVIMGDGDWVIAAEKLSSHKLLNTEFPQPMEKSKEDKSFDFKVAFNFFCISMMLYGIYLIFTHKSKEDIFK